MRIFKGHVAKLLRHPCGSTVIDELYRAGNAQQQAAMASELYGCVGRLAPLHFSFPLGS